MAIRGYELLERAGELDDLARLTEQVRAGRGALVAIEGPAGIGKTALVGAASTQADGAGLRVLRARGGELESGHPFGLARQLFEPAVHEASARERARVLDGPGELAMPALGLGGRSVDDGHAVLHGLYRLCANLAADGPLMLAIDDVHWSDPATLRWLVYLAARIETVPVALVVATRPPELVVSAELLTRLLADPAVVSMRLRELSGEAVAQLVGERWDEVASEFVAACREVTGGNPFLVRELLAACRSEGIAPERAAAERVRALGPTSISRAMLLRLGTMTAAARELARAVAVLGTQVPLVHAAALAGVTPQQASEAADVLAAAGILMPSRPLDFVHPIIRAAIYGELAAGERSREHGRAADLLEQSGASPVAVATHLIQVEPVGDAVLVERLRRAAAGALAGGSADGAVRFLERALAEPPATAQRAQLLFALGRARSRSGSGDAIAPLQEARALAGEPRRRAEIVLELLPLVNNSGGTLEELSMLADSAGGELDPLADRELLLAVEAWDRGPDCRLEAERLARYRDLPGTTHAERLMLAAVGKRLMQTVTSSAAEAAAIIARALRGLGGLPVGLRAEFDLAGSAAITAVACDRFDDLIEPILRHWLDDARRLGLEHWLAPAVTTVGNVAFRNGDLARAEALLLEGIEMSGGASHDAHGAGPGLVIVRLARGDAAGATAALELPQEHVDQDVWPVARAALKLARGELAGAVDALLAYGSAMEHMGWLHVDVPHNWRARAAPPLARLGRVDEARALLDEGLVRAHAWGTPRGIGTLLHARGLVEETAGKSGVATLEQAVETLASSPARLDHATALVDLGAALRRSNQRAAAREHLRDGLELARDCAATPIAERAQQELQATGARARKPLRSGIDSLTSSELRVAELAAEGRSNPEIAQTLFVTVKTVETHLGHTYAKLGIRSRSQLESALAAGR